MSSRALKKLGKLDSLDINLDNVENEDEFLRLNSPSNLSKKKKKKNKNKELDFSILLDEPEVSNDEETKVSNDEEIKVSIEETQEAIEEPASQSELKNEKVKPNLFAMLNDDTEEVQDGASSEHSSPEKEFKPVKTRSKAKKKPKKKKPVSSPNTEELKDDISMNEFDKILEEANSKFRTMDDKQRLKPGCSKNDSNTMAPNQDLYFYKKLLVVENKNLDPLIETTRLFGSKIVQSVMKKTKAHRFGRTSLSTPRDTWPYAQKLGLSMDPPEIVEDVQFFKFTHSTKYREIQRAFYQAVASLDPNNIMALSHISPYHVDVLLQLSEIAKNSGQVTEASEFIERALFSCEKAFHSSFSLSSGVCRLNFNQLENRSFYLALVRRLQFLSRQGCWRTALEFSKALLGLSPVEDPLGALFYLDFLALKAQEYNYLVQFYQDWPDKACVQYLPNFAYSVPLAKFHLSKKKTNDEQSKNLKDSDSVRSLAEAIVLFPSVIVGLVNKASVAPGESFSKIRTHAELFQSTVPSKDSQLKALSDLYIERAHSLWKEADVTEFIQAGVLAAAQLLSQGKGSSMDQAKVLWDADTTNEITYAICRHLVVSDIPEMAKHIPEEIRKQAMYMHDPVPPLESVSLYDDFRQLPGYGQANREALGSNLAGSFTSALETLRELFRNNSLGENDQNPQEGDPDQPEINAQSLLRMITNLLPSSFADQEGDDDEDYDPLADGVTSESDYEDDTQSDDEESPN